MKNKLLNINALILIGGKSSRMGTDKSKLRYFDKPQYAHIYNLLLKYISKEQIYYSVRNEKQITTNNIIIDLYPNLGPFGAIYSAFKYDNTKSWFVFAIDIPLVKDNQLNILFKNRDTSKIATTFKGISKKYPEPLITIWEPKAFPILEKNFIKQNLSLVSILKENDVKILPINDNIIININTKKAFNRLKNIINNKSN